MIHKKGGVYLSDVRGHLLILGVSPTRVTCLSCADICNRSTFKNRQEFNTAATAFVAKHGALDRWIAENIEEVVAFYLDNKVTRWVDDQGRPWAQDAKGNTVCVPDVFDLPKDTHDGGNNW